MPMSMYIALLRGINVGGRNKVAMAALREFLAELGLDGAKTLLQSGNVVFQSEGKTAAALESLLEKETAARLGVAADYLVRSSADWAKVVAANPFPKEAEADPAHLVVMFLKSAPTPSGLKMVQASIKGPEVIKGRGRELYIVYPEGIGTSKLTGASIERNLGIRGSARNWNTVLKLLAVAQS
jgi:uncharacterized protein (DUF1697 family)